MYFLLQSLSRFLYAFFGTPTVGSHDKSKGNCYNLLVMHTVRHSTGPCGWFLITTEDTFAGKSNPCQNQGRKMFQKRVNPTIWRQNSLRQRVLWTLSVHLTLMRMMMAKHPEVGRLNESQPRVPQHQKVISLMISCQDYLVLSLLALNFPFSTYALLWNQAPLFLMLCGLGWRGRLKWEDFQACQLNKD